MDRQKETQIIASVLSGNTDEYRYLVERYHQGLRYYLQGMLGDAEVADDIAQETFIRAYEKLSQYKPQFAFSTWLYRIGSNMALQYMKKKKPTSIEDFVEVIPDDKPSAGEEFDKTSERKRVRQAVMNLSDDYRQVVTLYYWQGMSYEQIADVLERPIGTIRTWLHRAKEDLREELYGQV